MSKSDQIDLKELKEIITETELMEFLGLTKSSLYHLRSKGLPYCPISKSKRIYLVKDVLDFVVSKRMAMFEEY